MDEEEDRPYGKFLYTVRSDGSELTKVSEDVVSVPAWSPDGERLALARIERNVVALYTLAADGSDLRILTTIPNDKSFFGAFYGSWIRTVSWSPDGRQVLYTCDDGACVVDLESGRVIGLVRGFYHWYDEPYLAAWSPDGERIALYTPGIAYDHIPARLFTVARDGTNLRGLVWQSSAVDFTGELVAWNAPSSHAAVDTSVCAGGLCRSQAR